MCIKFKGLPCKLKKEIDKEFCKYVEENKELIKESFFFTALLNPKDYPITHNQLNNLKKGIGLNER